MLGVLAYVILLAYLAEAGQHYGWRNSSYGTPVGYTIWNSYNVSQPRGVTQRSNHSQVLNGKHNFVWGNRTFHDRLLYYSRVKKSSSFLTVVTENVDFPARYQRPNGTISFIQILDQKPIGKGGYASILRGGLGYKNVTIHFTSQRNYGFDFIVSIYGH